MKCVSWATTALALLVSLTLVSVNSNASEISVAEARRFIAIQQDSYNVMVTGQGRLKRACSVPLDLSDAPARPLPDIQALQNELRTESKRFTSRASGRLSVAKRDRALQCKNPVGKVLELFGVNSPCTEAEKDVGYRQEILKVARSWERLLEAQSTVLTEARSLESKGCLSPGFTSKLTSAYEGSLKPQGVPLQVLFDQWTSN